LPERGHRRPGKSGLLALDPLQRSEKSAVLCREVMLRRSVWIGHRTLEIEGEPILNANPTRPLRQVDEECQIENQGGGEDGIPALEIDLDLHRISEPPEEVDVVPALFGVTARRVVLDPHLVKNVSVK